MATQTPATTGRRISSYSQGNCTCVEVADLSDGRIAVRNSTDSHGPTVLFTRAEMHGLWLELGVRALLVEGGSGSAMSLRPRVN